MIFKQLNLNGDGVVCSSVADNVKIATFLGPIPMSYNVSDLIFRRESPALFYINNFLSKS